MFGRPRSRRLGRPAATCRVRAQRFANVNVTVMTILGEEHEKPDDARLRVERPSKARGGQGYRTQGIYMKVLARPLCATILGFAPDEMTPMPSLRPENHDVRGRPVGAVVGTGKPKGTEMLFTMACQKRTLWAAI